jgi:hypothetical protein
MAARIERADLAAMIASRKLAPREHARALYMLDFIDKINSVKVPLLSAPTALPEHPDPSAPDKFLTMVGWPPDAFNP